VVKPSYGLTDNEIERMLRDSIAFAREDEQARTLREQQVDADRLIAAVQAALAADGGLLETDERAGIDHALSGLKEARESNNAARIKRAVKSLDTATQAFAARRMDANIRRALTGHRLEEFGASRDKTPS
jgi:molecular chaperone HscA